MLIFPNGTAAFSQAATNSDIDENGKPVESAEFGDPIPCFIETSSEDKRGRNDDGAYPRGSFSVSLDYGSIDETSFNPSKVRLIHERKGELGDFTIQRKEFYDITRTVQIWV
jgi:hypothetical protein